MNTPEIISLEELKDSGLDIWVDETGLHLAPPRDEEKDEQ